LLAPSEAATCADATHVVRPVWPATMADVASPGRPCTGGATSNHTCVITTSRADDSSPSRMEGNCPPWKYPRCTRTRSRRRACWNARSLSVISSRILTSAIYRSLGAHWMNRGCPEWPFHGQHGALVARVAAIHRLQGREGVRRRERKEHPKSVPAPGSTARRGSAAFRRPTPDGSYAAVSVPMRPR
jgi:hypothetical protein